jgi:hypothetical protein
MEAADVAMEAADVAIEAADAVSEADEADMVWTSPLWPAELQFLHKELITVSPETAS